MVLDNEEQRGMILEALRNVNIQGDYEGISRMLPKFTALIDAVKNAEIKVEEAPTNET